MSDQRMPQITGVELLDEGQGEVPAGRPDALHRLSPTWSRSSPRSTRGTSTGSSRSPGSPRSCEAAVRQAAAEYDRLTAAADETRAAPARADRRPASARVDAPRSERGRNGLARSGHRRDRLAELTSRSRRESGGARRCGCPASASRAGERHGGEATHLAGRRRRGRRAREPAPPVPSHVPRPDGRAAATQALEMLRDERGPPDPLRPADARDDGRRLPEPGPPASSPTRSGCSSPATPTSRPSSTPSTKGISSATSSSPGTPAELEGVIRQAAEQYELLAERKRLIAELQAANAQLPRPTRSWPRPASSRAPSSRSPATSSTRRSRWSWA